MRAHFVDPFAAVLDRLQIVADRLLARDFGYRADDRLEEARHLRRGRAELEARAGRGVDIDEAPVDLALGRALAQRVHRRAERRIDQHRSVDQHCGVDRVGGELARQRAFEKRIARRPTQAAFREHPVKLSDAERRERAGKARCRARGEGQFGRIGERARAMVGKWDDEPVLGFHYLRWRMQFEPFGMAAKVGDGDEQIERLAAGQQSPVAAARRHRLQRVEDQVGKAFAPERRFEPARADELRQLGADFAACAGLYEFIDPRRPAPLRHPGDRQRPELGQPVPRRRFGIDQRLDIRGVEPQLR